MLNQKSLRIVDRSLFGTQFRKPAFGSYCFAHLPATIRSLLGDTSILPGMCVPADAFPHRSEPYQKVIFLFVDAFGWTLFEKCKEKFPFLERVLRDGIVSKMTSMFPSTTAVHVTTMHTGIPVSESGVVEWRYYEPLVDRVILPLLFSFSGDKQRETLNAAGHDPRLLFPTATLYQALGNIGVPSWIFQHRKYTPSPLADVVFQGATAVPYKDEISGIRSLAETIRATKGPGYFFIYFDSIDAICHEEGPDAEKSLKTAERLFAAIEKELIETVGRSVKDALVVAIADHGQAPVAPFRTFYVNQKIPHLLDSLRCSSTGAPLLFGGSARDLMLYLKPERIDEIQSRLMKELEGRAEIHRTEELERAGLFGPSGLTPHSRARMGDLWILPYEQESTYWFEKNLYEVGERGHHGGLTPLEMDTALMVLPL